MEGILREEIKSPQEIEEGINSIQTVTWNPFIILPKEIYVIIFDYLDNPVDKRNFMNAHIKWFHLFKAKRTTFLFEGVFQEMSKIVDKKGIGLTSQDPYNYRLVCHDWDKAVENFFQLHPKYFMLDMDCNGSRVISKWEPKRIDWRNARKLEKYIKRLPARYPKNPFLSRSILLFIPNSNDIDMRYAKLVSFVLKRYGQYIWHCNLHIKMKLNPEACFQIAKWLSLMPELKTLKLTSTEWCSFPLTTDNQERIKNMTIPQPGLSKLVVLKSSCLPSQVFNKLFGNLKLLEKIQILGWKESLRNFRLPTDQENLKEAFFNLDGLPDFQWLAKGNPFPNIKTLVLKPELDEDYRDEEEHTFVEWPKRRMMWGIIEAKFPALENLNLRLPWTIPVGNDLKAPNQILETPLNLGKLKKMRITLPNFDSMNYLIPCGSIEELNVHIEHPKHTCNLMNPDDAGKYKNLKLDMVLKTMWESKVWDEFPKLRVLDIASCREGWCIDFYHYEKKGDKKTNYFHSV